LYDTLVSPDALAEGRPGPLAMYRYFVDLAVYPPSAVLKVDDTAPGIAEGVAAGCPSVGVALSGNTVARSLEDLARLSPDEVSELREAATRQLLGAVADIVIDTVAGLPELIETWVP